MCSLVLVNLNQSKPACEISSFNLRPPTFLSFVCIHNWSSAPVYYCEHKQKVQKKMGEVWDWGYDLSVEHKIWGSLALCPGQVYRRDMICSSVFLSAVCHQSGDGDCIPVPWCVWVGPRSAWNGPEPMHFPIATLPYQRKGEYCTNKYSGTLLPC